MTYSSHPLSLTCAVLVMALGVGCNNNSNEAPASQQAPAAAPTTTNTFGDPNGANSQLWDYDIDALPVETGILGYAPDVAPAIRRSEPALVKIELEVSERVGELADGTEYLFWTFGGSVPGPMMRVREGDTVEFTLMNHPDSRLPHNIDLHSVIGQGGGAEATFVAPGEQKTFRFRAQHPGVYIYHCATAPVGMHIANGMYGLFVVEPAAGWPEVDREFYVVQSEFYTEGHFGEQGLQPFNLDRALAEDPGYVVFNGRTNSLVGDNAMRASVGDRIRIFFGNGGPNLTSSFHVIGEIFDTVRTEGGTSTNHHVQTTTVGPGAATIVEFQPRVPSTLVLVDHAIFRAFNKGAIGTIVVEGEPAEQLFLAHHQARVYVPSPGRTWGAPEVSAARSAGDVFVETRSDDARFEAGRTIYNTNCASCHQESGTGFEGVFPNLTVSEVLLDTPEVVRSIRQGRRGDMGMMPNFPGLNARDIADVISYSQRRFRGTDELHDANDIQAMMNGAAE